MFWICTEIWIWKLDSHVKVSLIYQVLFNPFWSTSYHMCTCSYFNMLITATNALICHVLDRY